MVVMYPLTTQFDYTELRFSLRSVNKYLKNISEIIIVGDHIPEWLTNVTQIALADVPGKKQLSIRRKILAALEYTDEILFLNDDVFLLQPMSEFPYYWHGYLKKYSESGARPLEKELELKGMETRHWDGHFPLVYNQNFKKVSQHFTDDCIIKSMYCNALCLIGNFTPDCKLLREAKPEIIRKFIEGKPCFSTGHYSLKSALPILHELFPEPSKYEI